MPERVTIVPNVPHVSPELFKQVKTASDLAKLLPRFDLRGRIIGGSKWTNRDQVTFEVTFAVVNPLGWTPPLDFVVNATRYAFPVSGSPISAEMPLPVHLDAPTTTTFLMQFEKVEEEVTEVWWVVDLNPDGEFPEMEKFDNNQLLYRWTPPPVSVTH